MEGLESAATTVAADLVERIRRFVRAAGAGTPGDSIATPDAGCDTFDTLVREAFAYQVSHIAPVRALAAARGIGPDDVHTWRDVPAVPALAYKSQDLLPDDVDPARVLTFRSSGTLSRTGSRAAAGGTTGTLPGEARRSVHRHPFPSLYRETIDAAFPGSCLPRRSGLHTSSPGAEGSPGADRSPGAEPALSDAVPMLSLIPARADVPDSSLSFMVNHVLERWGAAGSATVLGPAGLNADAAAAWVRAAGGPGNSAGPTGPVDRTGGEPPRPCLVLATGLALAGWLERLEEADTVCPLPPGSVVFETGGSKGRSHALGRAELLAAVARRLAVPPERVVREYGMTELTSQLYTRVLTGGDPDLFMPPPWARVHVLDPETLDEAAPGTLGLVAIFDLANLGSAVHLLTEDLGVLEEGGLRLAGRARGAALRGCSLTAEEMMAPR